MAVAVVETSKAKFIKTRFEFPEHDSPHSFDHQSIVLLYLLKKKCFKTFIYI